MASRGFGIHSWHPGGGAREEQNRTKVWVQWVPRGSGASSQSAGKAAASSEATSLDPRPQLIPRMGAGRGAHAGTVRI